MERRYSDCGSGRIGKVGCIRDLSSKNERESNTDQTKDDEFIFPFPDGTAKMSGRDYEFGEPHSEAGTNRGGAKISVENFKANRESLNLQKQTDDAEAPCRLLVDSR